MLARGRRGRVFKNLLVTAPDELREPLAALTTKQLVIRCARMHRSPRRDALSATRYALRSLARRHQILNEEIAELDGLLADLTAQAAPRLLQEPGVGPEIAARLLLVAGDNPTRTAQRRRARRALRRVPDRGVERQDHPPPPQPRR